MSIKDCNHDQPKYYTIETEPNNSYINISKNIYNKEKRESINSYNYLPSIDNNSKKLSFHNPNSILNKFIINHAKDVINYAKKDLQDALVIQNKFKNENSNSQLLSKSHKNIILKSEEKSLFNKKIKFMQNKKLNKNSLGFLLNINKSKSQKSNITNINQKKVIITEITKDKNDEKSTISDNNDININDLYDKYNEEILIKEKSSINSIEINSKASKENKKSLLSNNFRRICSFQPDILVNWKYKYGLKINSGNPTDFKIANKDINYQCKIIDNNYKLLFNDINYYKNKIMKNSNYFSAFENLSLLQKIHYNKTLEETIGILFVLPKMLLNDFYKLIQNSYDTNFIKIEKLKEKYVFDENINLKDNNKLLFEIVYYFKDCYQIFLVIVKEFENILIKPSDFSKIISCFEKARYNISYINNSSENAFYSYKKDLDIINKFRGHNNNNSLKNLYEKLRENYSFKQNKEKQLKKRINNSLTDRDNNNKNGNIKKQIINSPYRSIKIKSIINSRMMTDIMRYSREDSRLKISTERIYNQIEGENRIDAIRKKSLPPVIKINI